MEQHSSCGNKDSEKDHYFDLGSLSFSQNSFSFVYGFVLCLVLENIYKRVKKEDDSNCNGSYDKSVDLAAAAQPASVYPDQTSEPCTVVKQEAPDQQIGEQEAHAGLRFYSSDLIAPASQKIETNTTEIENLHLSEKAPPFSSFYLCLTASDSGHDTHDEDLLTDTSSHQPNDLSDVQEGQLVLKESKHRKRKQTHASEVKGTRKQKQARQADKAKKSTFKLSPKLTKRSNSKVSQKPSSDINKKPATVFSSNAVTETALDDADMTDTVVPITSQLFTCDECNKTFTSARSCKMHALKVHTRNGDNVGNQKASVKVFHARCDKCPKVYSGRCAAWNLHQHVLAHHSELTPVQCDVCNSTLNNKHHLKLHKRSSHRKDVCYICGAHFVTQVGLQTHLLAHKGDRSYICEICGAAFVRVSSLRQHSKLHTDSRDFKCERCTLTFKTFPSLSLHMMCVHQCGSYFSSHVQKLAKLGYGIEKDSVERLQNCQCVTCGQKLVDSACPLHSSDCLLSFSCPQCQWTTKDIQKFGQHLVNRNNATAHSGADEMNAEKKCGGLKEKKRPLVKNFVCASCGKQFYTQSHLQVHRYQHAEKRFSCPVCDKSFTYKCNMQKHATTHTDARPFECQICQKTFKMKSQLQFHQRYHDGEFKCEICGKVLTRKQYVINHYKLVHPETQKSK